jgi:hypothetical protein
MDRMRDVGWWYWVGMVVLLAGEAAGCPLAAEPAVALGLVQAVHFAARERSLTVFTVQVKVVYLGLLVIGLWPSLVFIHWAQLAGTAARVAFDYCPLARTLYLLPWNRRQSLTLALVWRAYTTPPVRGSIARALAASA